MNKEQAMDKVFEDMTKLTKEELIQEIKQPIEGRGPHYNLLIDTLFKTVVQRKPPKWLIERYTTH